MWNISTTIIDENLLSQVDEEGRINMIIEKIINFHVVLDEKPIYDSHYDTKNGFKQRKKTSCRLEVWVK